MSRTIQFVLLAALTAACTPPAPAATTPAPAARPGAQGRPRPTAADIKFMQDMIGHHAQAVEMARLVPGRTSRKDLAILSERIIVSQVDEINIMRQWLRDQGAAVPDSTKHDPGAMAMESMPGMATPAELSTLTGLRGTEFERMFLQLMIKHHGGAIIMVERLFGVPGAGQDDMIFKFASDVAADQESEIARMQSILDSLQTGASH